MRLAAAVLSFLVCATPSVATLVETTACGKKMSGVYEGADLDVSSRFRTSDNVVAQVASVSFNINDLTTGTLIYTTPAPIVPTSKTFKTVVPSAYQTIVRRGFCSLSKTVCDDDSDCAVGQSCNIASGELHRFTFKFVFDDGGQGIAVAELCVIESRFNP